MKKLIFIFFALLVLGACKQKDYVAFEVKIDGLETADSILRISGNGVNKNITLNSEGVFKDTMKVKNAGFLSLILGKKGHIQAFVNNGFDLDISGNIKNIDSSIVFKGKGSQNCTYLYKRMEGVKDLNNQLKDLYLKDSITFMDSISKFESKMTDLLTAVKKADTTLVRMEQNGLNDFVKNLKGTYGVRHEQLLKFGRGAVSPVFENYESYQGGTKSLVDYKGKYVYINFWMISNNASINQMTSLNSLQEKYKDQNIVFLNICADKKTEYKNWKKMVAEKALKGEQLFTNEDIAFMQAYNIRSMPRAIMIDPNGNIFEANAALPSLTERIQVLFNEAGLVPTVE